MNNWKVFRKVSPPETRFYLCNIVIAKNDGTPDLRCKASILDTLLYRERDDTFYLHGYGPRWIVSHWMKLPERPDIRTA